MTDATNALIYQNMMGKFQKTKELVHFSMQLEASIKHDSIKPEYFLNRVVIDEGDAEFTIERDWTKYPEALKNDFAVTSKIAISSFMIISCKESYAQLFQDEKRGREGLQWASKDKEPDLYSAQMILRVVRNALGHFKSQPTSHEAWGVWSFDANYLKDVFEVKSIEVSLDTRSLEGQQFAWSHMGGVKNFIKVLDYLEADLLRRLKDIKP